MRKIFTSLFFVIATCGLCFGGNLSDLDLEARGWINNPEFKLRDQRDVLVYFFELPAKANDVQLLNRLMRRRNLVVIGLTSASLPRTKAFVEKSHARFCVGAGSKTAKKLRIDRFPDFRLIRRGSSEAETIDVAQLSQWADESDSKESDEIRRLKDAVAGAATGSSRISSIQRLWEAYAGSEGDEFVQIAEAQIAAEKNPWVRGEWRYWLEMASSDAPYDSETPPSQVALQEFRSAGDDPRWAEVSDLMHNRSHSAQELFDIYDKHGSTQPGDLLMRLFSLDRLGELTDPKDRAAARNKLFTSVREETDRTLRLHAVGALGKIAPIGDRETIDFLSSQVENEPSVRHVRAAMEYTIEYLRTGQDDPDLFQGGTP